MAEPQKKNPLGRTGRTVADNIKRLRGDMQYVKLAAKLDEIGRPIPTLGLRKIESYERRVDADDLVALAAALGVSPVTLLMPAGVAVDDVVAVCNAEFKAATLWEWLIAEWPFPRQGGLAEFFARALPSWKLAEVERRIANRHGGESVQDLDRPVTVLLEGPSYGDD
ncbi:XRE family transcriptional regulator [Mycolicibacterium lutetiense]|uniref:HTH cro/C1-type domain-containing protein n=1 Tax=Mycolicibacterium lutetiense TaxID=1641992 RepID=A0ABS5A0C5_9MYCO|nr:XRE family transcriptional regulator [Mycolicibacterium lutetiense]MBP2455195.1 hypothetical protein [Mycolicibacterium lutetiense]